MELTIFKKMKVKPSCVAHVINPPNEYPTEDLEFEFRTDGEEFDFVHLFISSQAQFQELISTAKKKCKSNGLLWISYPKSNGKIKYDINRDSLWDLSVVHGLHPVAQISLDEKWSAVRFLPHNDSENEKFRRPIK